MEVEGWNISEGPKRESWAVMCPAMLADKGAIQYSTGAGSPHDNATVPNSEAARDTGVRFHWLNQVKLRKRW